MEIFLLWVPLNRFYAFLLFYLEKKEKSGEREISETKINNLRYFLVFLPCQ